MIAPAGRLVGAAAGAWAALGREGGPALVARIGCELDWLRSRRRAVALEGSWPQVDVLRVLPRPAHPARGGVERALVERLAVEDSPWALLTPDATGLRLEVANAGRRRCTQLPGVLDGEAILAVAERLGARVIHIENLSPLDPETLAGLGQPGTPRLLVGLHDFGAFCVRPHLFEAGQGHFCEATRDLERCHRCLSAAKDDRSSAALPAWRTSAGRLLGRAAAVVVPSAWLRERLRQALAQDLDSELRWEVIAPATAPEDLPAVGATPRRALAVLGSFRAEKGAEIVLPALAQADFPVAQVAQFGPIDPAYGPAARRRFGLRRGFYRPGTLGRLLRRHQVGLAVVASVVPESHSLVADEAWRAGVPIVCFDHGALAARVRSLGGGWLLPPPTDPAVAVESLTAFVRQWAAGEMHQLVIPKAADLPTPRGAAESMTRLYEELALIRTSASSQG